ncbi:MAG: DMT family transporter [Candidatus Binatia bacterium]
MQSSSANSRLHQPSGRAGLGFALAMTTVSLWSILPVGLKLALGGVDPLTLTWIRFMAAALFLGVLLKLRGNMPPVGLLARHHWMLMAVAAAGLAGNYGFYALGLHFTNAGTSQVVIQIAPMLLTLGGIVVFKERFAAVQWLGFGVLLAGLALFSSDQIAHLVGSLDRYYTGLGFLVAGAVTWAAYGLAQKQLLGRMGSPQIMLCLYAAGAMIFAPLATPAALLDLDTVQFAALVFCTANMLLSYATFSEALAHVEASRVSALLAAVPLGTLAAVHAASLFAPSVFAPEPVTTAGIAGATLVVCGSLMTSLGRG